MRANLEWAIGREDFDTGRGWPTRPPCLANASPTLTGDGQHCIS